MNKSPNTPSLSDTTAEQIILYIQEHNLSPGDKLPTEHKLIEMLKISRSTLREAFKSLISRNILETRQGAGTFVSPKRGIPTDPLGLTFIQDSASLALDLIDIRLILEPELAALASVKASPEQIKKIEAACLAAEEDICADRSHAYNDLCLHREIAAGSGNKIAINLVSIIHSSINQNILITNSSLREHARSYHRQIVERIKAHDPQGARYAVIMHLNRNRDFILEKQNCVQPN